MPAGEDSRGEGNCRAEGAEYQGCETKTASEFIKRAATALSQISSLMQNKATRDDDKKLGNGIKAALGKHEKVLRRVLLGDLT